MMQPNGQMPMNAEAEEESREDSEEGNSVTITKNPDGSFMVGEQMAKDIDEALSLARAQLVGDDGGMSVEQAFQGGFGKSDGGMMGGGY